LVELHLGQPLPRLTHAAREQEPRHRERAVADEPVPDLVPRVEDVDPPDLVLRSVIPAIPEDLPHLFGRRVDDDRERVLLQGNREYDGAGYGPGRGAGRWRRRTRSSSWSVTRRSSGCRASGAA